MEQYKNLDIVEVPLGSPHFSDKVSRFLGANGLRMEALDSYYSVQDQDGNILAGAGISGDIIKCVAVSSEMRSEGLLTPLISRIVAGRGNLKVFTKPEYRILFESLGFKLLASAPLAILLENGRGLQQYCQYLKESAHAAKENYFSGRRQKNQFPSASTTPSHISVGVIVMNANPFTLGHKYLIDKAKELVDMLYVIPVKEDLSKFPYTERLAMIRAGVENPCLSFASPTAEENYFSRRCAKNQFPSASTMPPHIDGSVVVLEGSDYSISAATFPTYFLKDLSDASETQMRLDLDLFTRHIAPALGATLRFVGTEPNDPLTARYNALMQEILPANGINCIEIARYQVPVMPGADRASHTVSASAVRKALSEGSFADAAAMCPASTHPYLLAALAERALRMELDTPLKPGLVCPDSNGAHKDMDYALMLKGIGAIRPFFPRMAMAGTPTELKQLGIDAESAMMSTTGGVNTHRGAIFAIGLALNAVGHGLCSVDCDQQPIDTQFVNKSTRVQRYLGTVAKQLIDSNLQNTPVGARRMALTGYQQLFDDWLPFYRNLPSETTNNEKIQRLLLHIMSTLDDTCIMKRVGKERAEQLRHEISGTSPKMTELCEQFVAEGISPGGAADMVSLTLFIDSIL